MTQVTWPVALLGISAAGSSSMGLARHRMGVGMVGREAAAELVPEAVVTVEVQPEREPEPEVTPSQTLGIYPASPTAMGA